MVFLNIDTKNFDEQYINGKTKIQILNDIINNNKSKVFILYYMEGCGPCNATRPEWNKIKNSLKKFKNNNNVAIVDIDQVLSSKIHKLKPPNSFPTMRFITDGGKKIQNYEDSNITKKDRTIDCFVNWINSETKHMQNGGTRKLKKKHKWSLKYKRSINCRNPRGFSQKQYCKYGRK
jgi:hypothetical protein